MSGRLIVVRHAESRANTAGAVESIPPGRGLSELGVQQATDLAERLRDRRVGRVLCSESLRTIETAEPVARQHGLEPEAHRGLCEIYCGAIEGRSDPGLWEVYNEVFGRWITGEPDVPMPEGESWNEIRDRMMVVLGSLPEPPWTSDVVLVSHGGSIRILVSTLLGEEAGAELGYPRNAGTLEIEPVGGGRWVLAGHDEGIEDYVEQLGPRVR